MRILLLGEFSGVHKNLKEGLEAIGHEVTFASQGDGFKNILGDIDLRITGNVITRRLKYVKQLFHLIELVKGYDIVQLINPFIFYRIKLPNKLNIYFLRKLIQNSKKFFLLAAGSDSFFWKIGREKLSYGPFDDFLKYDLNGAKSYFLESKRAFEFNKFVADSCHGIIPVMYEYQISYEGHKNLLKGIPQPINTEKISYQPNVVTDKVVIFHGLTRYGFKGTRYVEEAFKILSEKYGDQVELIINGKMPMEKYLNIMRKANIVIDQTNSYSVGMNGLYAMAMGKVVLGGAEPESLKFLGVDSSPVINIKPSAQDIVEKIEKLLSKKELITELGLRSRKFVEQIHGHIHIAKRFIEVWSSK
jgi:glycosyltransferase involved in cell wall biosynthesis